jgi:hypothetical protein
MALRVEPELAFHPADVLRNAPDVDLVRIDRRWNRQPERDATGDPLLAIPPAVYVSELLRVRSHPGRKVSCPFHTDERPSLHIYVTPQRGWACFSCGRGGSIYDLAAATWGIGTRGRDFLELRRRLSATFAAELAQSFHRLER